MSGDTVLSVRGLRTSFGPTVAVDGVSFEIGRGEVFGLVGESGSGKSATCRSIVRLFAGAKAKVEAERIRLGERDLTRPGPEDLAAIRGAEVSMVFQDPMTALNPTMTIGRQIGEVVERHFGLSGRALRARTVELLREVGVTRPEERLGDYPHQFSGGMRQRVLIAIALACRPKLLIADEPTTALDVTVQDQILKLILKLRREHGTGVLLVTHDLGVVAQTCDRVAVMYAGRIVETAPVRELFARPSHPYTRALLAALPRPGVRRLEPIGGAPPDLANPPRGCRFHPRCRMAIDACQATDPALLPVEAGHSAACIRLEAVP
jgi:peptide/nickel transport system ATP-binding protein/oligopeptide transport system ATP-binding protein